MNCVQATQLCCKVTATLRQWWIRHGSVGIEGIKNVESLVHVVIILVKIKLKEKFISNMFSVRIILENRLTHYREYRMKLSPYANMESITWSMRESKIIVLIENSTGIESNTPELGRTFCDGDRVLRKQCLNCVKLLFCLPIIINIIVVVFCHHQNLICVLLEATKWHFQDIWIIYYVFCCKHTQWW